MDWIKAFPDQELKEGDRRLVQVSSRKLLVIRFRGKLYAIESKCPHQRFPLTDGKISDDGSIICPFHHSAFDLETGDVKEWAPWDDGADDASLKAKLRQRVLMIFPIKVEDGFVWVSARRQNA